MASQAGASPVTVSQRVSRYGNTANGALATPIQVCITCNAELKPLQDAPSVSGRDIEADYPAPRQYTASFTFCSSSTVIAEPRPLAMDPDPPELTTALFRWANTFDLGKTIESWRDLQDGHALWKILQDVEPDYFSGELPESVAVAQENWIPRWQNLKHIDRLVMMFIRDECGKLLELSKRMTPDLKAVAIDASSEDLIQVHNHSVVCCRPFLT